MGSRAPPTETRLGKRFALPQVHRRNTLAQHSRAWLPIGNFEPSGDGGKIQDIYENRAQIPVPRSQRNASLGEYGGAHATAIGQPASRRGENGLEGDGAVAALTHRSVLSRSCSDSVY